MRNRNIETFLMKLARDPSLNARVEQLDDADIASLMKIAAEVGVPFTAQEYNDFLRANGLGEIPEDELAAVAGGALPESSHSIKIFLKSKQASSGDSDSTLG